MEFNKDEASKAKGISEQRLTENDFAGAKEFALKAQALNPETEGLSQLMMTINVYVSAEKKVGSGGEVDWYGVLGVTPTDDDEAIRKQYRKLALMIHPDKNKCIGADGAIKLVLDAWNLLSDKAQRYAYDQRRTSALNSNFFTNNWSSPPSGSNVRQPANTTSVPPRPPPKASSDHTFYTRCVTCKTYQKYPWKYMDQIILCRRCRRPFKAAQRAFTMPRGSNVRPPPDYTRVPPPKASSEDSFYTRCLTCMTYYEHPWKYVDVTIRCRRCQRPFKAALRAFTMPYYVTGGRLDPFVVGFSAADRAAADKAIAAEAAAKYAAAKYAAAEAAAKDAAAKVVKQQQKANDIKKRALKKEKAAQAAAAGGEWN